MNIYLTSLSPHPLNRHFDRHGEKWVAMVESVREHGIIQRVLVRKAEGGYQIVCGHRRAAAAAEAGLESLDCDVRAMNDRTVLELLVIENLERENPDPVEEGKLLRALEAEGVDVAILAHRLKRSVAWITTRQRLLDLGDEVLEAVRKPKDAAGHLGMGTVEILLAVAEEDRARAIQMVLHPAWMDDVLGPREAAEVIRSAILEPARRKAEWDKESKWLVKAWKKALRPYLTKAESKDLMVLPLCYDERETCRMRTQADEMVPPGETHEPEVPMSWVQLAVRHGLPVWVVPYADGDDALAVVDESLIRMAEEAAAEPLYEMRGGERVMVREHAGEPVLLSRKELRRKEQAAGGTGKTDDEAELPAPSDMLVAAAILNGEGDPRYDAEEPAERVIEQRMESWAWVDLGPVRRMREQMAILEWPKDALPKDAPDWLVAIWSGEHEADEIVALCDWILGLKR